jgi:hypothetical protein
VARHGQSNVVVYKRRYIAKLAGKGKIQGHTSGEIEVSRAGSKPSLASMVHQIDEASRLKSNLVDEVPANTQSISEAPLSPKISRTQIQNGYSSIPLFSGFCA